MMKKVLIRQLTRYAAFESCGRPLLAHRVMEVSGKVPWLRRRFWARVELDNSSPWPHLWPLCFSCLPLAKSNPHQINRLGTTFFINGIPCVYHLLVNGSVYNSHPFYLVRGTTFVSGKPCLCAWMPHNSWARTCALRMRNRADLKWRARARIKAHSSHWVVHHAPLP